MSPDLVEAVAQRVVELLRQENLVTGDGLVDAAAVAAAVGRTRGWVYDHKLELGGVALGEGSKPRWGFDLAEVRQRLAARSVSERSPSPDSPAGVEPLPHRRRARKGDGVDLLPIRADRRAA